MPRPIAVRLVPHDTQWASLAARECARIMQAAGSALLEIHHIGSTAVPGIAAKPVLDLLGVAVSLAVLDEIQSALEAIGYAWHGEYGLTGRRYCTLTDRDTGSRRAQLHSYVQGDPAIARHVAFRDHLRSRPDLAIQYQHEKARCAQLHPENSHAYTDCKHAWIKMVEADALSCRHYPSTG